MPTATAPKRVPTETTAAPPPQLALETVPTRPEVETRASVPKRCLDFVLALGGLLASAPLWPLIALAIKLEDGGPVFYSQYRVGRGGQLFRSWKFRSMSPSSETADVPRQAELEEKRITRVGEFLRATALDELPQLWNILRGEMSFVGPRALLPAEHEANGNGHPRLLHELPDYEERHSLRPGLTGIAQVHAPRDLPHAKKFRYDLLYVRKRTLWLDVRLIARSVWISLRAAWPENGKEEG